MHSVYPGLTGGNLHEISGWITCTLGPVQLDTVNVRSEQSETQSATEHVAPESDKMVALTANMYAMVKNVVVPARSSVEKVVLRSFNLKYFPTRVLPMNVLRRVNGGGFTAVSICLRMF